MGQDTQLDALLEEMVQTPETLAVLVRGEQLAARYVIERLVGVGGMGRVYRAKDLERDEPVAVKLVSAGRASRFDAETKVLAELSHPNVVRYVGHGQTPTGDRFLAMEWLEGQDLAQRLTRGGLTVADTLAVARCVASALSAAHARGVVHRDIKPSNLFLLGSDPQRLKVLDFGIARPGVWASSFANTVTGTVMGTVGYMAPEQAADSKDVDARADIFGLGCVLFECLAGRPAFAGTQLVAVLAKVLQEPAPRVRDLEPNVPPSLDELIASMLAKDPNDRPRDGAALLALLDALDVTCGHTEPKGRAVGSDERRLVSVMLADEGTAHRLGIGPLRASVAGAGGHLQRLADGTLLVTLRGRAGASQQAGPAAASALALRDAAPGMRVAVATGRAASSDDHEIGSVIDKAAALLATCEAERIAIDHATAALLGNRFAVVDKGAKRWLIGRSSALSDTRTLVGRPTPCVGRNKELALLQATVAECIDEPVARAILIVGPPGVGKSRLASELVRCVEDDIDVVIARGDAVAPGSALSIARQIARGITQEDRDPIDALLEKSADRLTLRAQIRRGFMQLVIAATERSPLLLVIEDVHWGDASSMSMLREVLSAAPESRLLILGLARPEVADMLPDVVADPKMQQVQLTGLSRRAVESLAKAVLGDEVEPARLAPITSRADGNPLFAEELIRLAAEGGDGELPDSALAIIEARLAAQDPAARRVLRAASVFGETAWDEGVAELLGERAPRDTTQWLDVLVDREVLTRVESGSVRFRHALVREAAYAMLTDEDREAAHRLAACWLQQEDRSDPMGLAEHWVRSDEPEAAAKHFLAAAEAAFIGNDVEATLHLAERGIEIGAEGTVRAELLVLQGEGIGWGGGRPADTIEPCEEALSLLEVGSASWVAALSLYGWGLVHSNTQRSRDDFVERCKSIDKLDPAASVALSTWRLVEELLGLGHPAEAARLLHLLDRAQPEDTVADGYRKLARGWAATFGALDIDAVAELESCGALLDGSGLPSLLGRVTHGVAAYAVRDRGLARRIFEEAREASEAMGAHAVTFVAEHWLGALDAGEGRWDAAITRLTRSAKAGDHVYEAMAESALAYVHLRAGHVEDARGHAVRAMEMTSHLPMVRQQALMARAMLALADREPEQARAFAEEGLALYERAKGWPGTGDALKKVLRAIGDAS